MIAPVFLGILVVGGWEEGERESRIRLGEINPGKGKVQGPSHLAGGGWHQSPTGVINLPLAICSAITAKSACGGAAGVGVCRRCVRGCANGQTVRALLGNSCQTGAGKSAGAQLGRPSVGGSVSPGLEFCT